MKDFGSPDRRLVAGRRCHRALARHLAEVTNVVVIAVAAVRDRHVYASRILHEPH